MNTWYARLLGAAVTLTVLTYNSQASANSLKSQARLLDTHQIMAENSSDPVESAEQLALAAEQLVTPLAFMHADRVLTQALSMDPENKRAQFYKALIAPSMALKGILAKIRPFIENAGGKGLRDYNDLIQYRLPNSGLKTFLLDGQPGIETEKDIQDFLVSFRMAQKKMRSFLKANKDLRLTLNMNIIDSKRNSLQKVAKDCSVQNLAEGVYYASVCNYSKAFQIKIERADVEVLQHLTAGMEIYTTLVTAYDLTGVLDVVENRWATDKEIFEYLQSFEDFGTLRKDHGLSMITDLGSDALAGAKWAYRLQRKLCPRGGFDERNRAGFLFQEGICIRRGDSARSVEDVFKTIELALSGQTMEVVANRDENVLQTQAAVAAPFLAPIEDLKAAFPLTYNRCGAAKNLADKTLLGIFPNADANTFLQLSGILDKKCY